MKLDIKIEGKKIWINGKRAKRIKTYCTRLCYKTNKYFIKIENEFDSDRSYFHQCRQEYRIWNKLSSEHKKYFVPIIKYVHEKKYDYIIEPVIKLRKGRKSKSSWEIIEKLANIYRINDVLSDLPCNWFITKKGSPIFLDYGV